MVVAETPTVLLSGSRHRRDWWIKQRRFPRIPGRCEGFFKKFVDSRAGGNGNGSESAKEKKQKKAERNSWLKFCRVVWKTRRVSWVGEIAGYRKGEIRHGNDRVLILKGPILPVAKKGNCSFTQTFLEQFLGEGAP
jgi:hypothetical protein